MYVVLLRNGNDDDCKKQTDSVAIFPTRQQQQRVDGGWNSHYDAIDWLTDWLILMNETEVQMHTIYNTPHRISIAMAKNSESINNIEWGREAGEEEEE